MKKYRKFTNNIKEPRVESKHKIKARKLAKIREEKYEIEFNNILEKYKREEKCIKILEERFWRTPKNIERFLEQCQKLYNETQLEDSWNKCYFYNKKEFNYIKLTCVCFYHGSDGCCLENTIYAEKFRKKVETLANKIQNILQKTDFKYEVIEDNNSYYGKEFKIYVTNRV